MFRNNYDEGAGIAGAISALLLTAVLCALPLCGGCDVSQDDAEAVLTKQGFTDVKTTGHAWFACGKDDSFASEFTAINPVGQPVEGVVCCGLMKSCTVRW